MNIQKEDYVSPCDGGCWFCRTNKDGDDWLFSFEFDTNLHKSCLEEAMKDENDVEAKIMGKELL